MIKKKYNVLFTIFINLCAYLLYINKKFKQFGEFCKYNKNFQGVTELSRFQNRNLDSSVTHKKYCNPIAHLKINAYIVEIDKTGEKCIFVTDLKRENRVQKSVKNFNNFGDFEDINFQFLPQDSLQFSRLEKYFYIILYIVPAIGKI